MKQVKAALIALTIVLLAGPTLAAEFDTSDYDSGVSNYLMEIHERLMHSPISQQQFQKLYDHLAKNPKAENLARVTMAMVNQAQKEGKGLTDQAFVVFVHRVVLGQFSLRRNYSREMVAEDLANLESGKVKQSDILKQRLASDMGQDRMGEIMTGEVIQQERFKNFKLSANK